MTSNLREGRAKKRGKADVIGRSGVKGLASVIDKKSSFWLLCQTVKPSFNDTIAFFVG